MNTENDAFETEQEMIMFYNVENLFVADEKPMRKVHQAVSGLRNWNESRFQNKLFKIAHVFELVKEEKGSMPCLIGLSEVQGSKPIEELLKQKPFDETYSFIHYESMDERGVDVALLYNRSKIEIVSSQPISFFFEVDDQDPENYDTTRDVLHCKLKYRGAIINVFVLHMPSKRENDVNKPKRIYMVNELKERINALIGEGESVIVMGDFNENPDDENSRRLIFNKENTEILINPFFEMFKSRMFSTFHFKFGLLFDQIIMSKDFTSAALPLKYVSAEVFNHQKISNWDKRFKGRPFRTFAGTRYLGGYSDHFPVIATFQHTKK